MSLAKLTCTTGLLVVGFLVAPLPAAPRKRPPPPDSGAASVEKVLRDEVAGPVDRRQRLSETLASHPDSPSARWQSGFVREGDNWRSFDDATGDAAATSTLNEYRRRRGETEPSFSGQMTLAGWCRKQGLNDQEYAHLQAALRLSPEQPSPALLARLGCRQVAGIWLSRENLRDWQKLNRQTTESLRRWEARLRSIAEGLSGSRAKRANALARLRDIAEPSAIPAIELILAGESEDEALVALETFARISGPEASLALAKQAVFSKWPEIRSAATKALRARNFDDFVPGLISLLATPVVRVDLPASSNFRDSWFFGPIVLWHGYLLARETEDQFQVASFHAVDFRINEYVNGLRLNGTEFRASRGNNRLDSVLTHDVSRLLADESRAQERALSELNDRTRELNSRIGSVLAGISGVEPSDDPKAWWSWWRSYSDTQQAGDKPLVSVSEDNVVGNPASPGIVIMSCFAAGTTVWTETGPVAIETITLGDRVLAKDVETGELAFKPVLQTTIRPPKELTTLRFDDETIVCTGGHRFWSSGTGWIKARDVTPQTLLHTVTGSTPVWSAKKGETRETYNLVVADFHTYFVGKTGVLCQDLLIPTGTSALVPGLSRDRAAAGGRK